MDKSIIDENTFLFIYQNICILNNINYDDSDITDEYVEGDNYKIIYLINKTCRDITIKTNRNEFPTDLKYLVIDLVNDNFEMLVKEDSPDTNQNVTSMSEAGRSIGFGATATWQSKYDLLLNQKMKDNETLINKYKLLYKVVCPYAKD